MTSVAHYMVGYITDEHVRQDIIDAQSLGLDAFAMNFDQIADWSTPTVDSLFANAKELGFKLFFSFDHAAGHFSSPDDYTSYLKDILSNNDDAYFKFNGKPVVSTFGGESVSDATWAAFRQNVGDILLVPGFYQATPSTTFFNSHSSLDGVFNWNSWPQTSEGKVAVSSADDQTFKTAASSASKLFMMGASPVQFKHIDEGQNWYRRGEDNLENRFGQLLDVQPDIIQLQTWNDGGESHYMGNVWPEPLNGATQINNLINGYDHKGYWQVLPAFIQAWKRGDTTTENMVPTNGKDIQGVFWHHTLTIQGTCTDDPVSKTQDVLAVGEDAVSGIVLVAKGKTNLVAVVNVGTKELGTLNLVEGYNKFKFTDLTPGKVQVEVWDGDTMIGGGYGPIEVTDSAAFCNYNFQVVGFPG